MLEMYKGVANSPETTITNDISESDTLIYVLDETRVPEELPNLMVLGTGVSAETIKVISIDGNALTVERGFQGVPRSWNAGTVIARNFTEYDYNALKENIETLKENVDTNADDILDLMSYVGDLENLDTTEKANLVLALNEIYQDLVAHKADYATNAIKRDGSVAMNSRMKFNNLNNMGMNVTSGNNMSFFGIDYPELTSANAVFRLFRGTNTTGDKIILLNKGDGSAAEAFAITNGEITRLNERLLKITAGAGSPEGSITASVGSIYLRADGGSGTTLYVKESGSGNTGWKAVQTA